MKKAWIISLVMGGIGGGGRVWVMSVEGETPPPRPPRGRFPCWVRGGDVGGKECGTCGVGG